MRILTPPEQREIQKLKDDLARFTDPNCGIELPDTLTIQIPYEKREMWLNVMSIVLQANDAMTKEWQRYPVLDRNLIEKGLVS
jgi:hypothetical protein